MTTSSSPAKANSTQGDWLSQHPRAFFYLCVFVPFFIWQSPVAVLGVMLFFLLVPVLKLSVWFTNGLGLFLAAVILAWHYESSSYFLGQSLKEFFEYGFVLNYHLWENLFAQSQKDAWFYYFGEGGINFLVGFSVLEAGLLHALSLIPDPPHYREMRALRGGRKGVVTAAKEQPARKLEAVLAGLRDNQFEGTLLGVSKRSGQAVVVSDAQVNQMVLVLGTTGSGKTVTLRRFYQHALAKNYPLIIVDGKPAEDNTAWLMAETARHKKPFYGFNCGDYWHYDPLAHGGYTELKDKLISLKDEWASDYYRSIAEDYLQTTFEVLLASGEPYDLKQVVTCLDYDELAVLVRKTQDERLVARVRRLGSYKRDDITGLQAHLSLLIHSELGAYFEKVANHTFTLREVIENKAVVYFALPALRFPSFSKVLGKLIINDIKAVIDRYGNQPIFTVFDEFSVFAGEQVLNLVNMGRGKGVHAIFGTQGLADLEKIHPTFASQVLNCVNTLICHRLNDQGSAESVASWAGTREGFDLTAQVDSSLGGSTGLGSVRRNKEFIVHPDAIKQELQLGEAFYITKVGQFRQDKIKVKYS